MTKKKKNRKYPPYPSAAWDYAVQETARQKLRKPNKFICIYCHGQSLQEQDLKHEPDCPARPVAKTITPDVPDEPRTGGISSDLFSYTAKTRTLAAEASSLGSGLSQAASDPVRVRSERTGKVVEFEYVRTTTDGEGDTTSWVYQNKELRLTLVIFND
jgi:hypothetical protein